MYQGHLADPYLNALLEKIDLQLASEAQEGGCPHCGGPLHQADYPRQPRGGPKRWNLRLSFCCGREGCRKRLTPASVRFLGRKIYTSVVVVLVSAMNHGLSSERMGVLRQALGMSRRTLQRWRQWWLVTFTRSKFWKEGRAWFMPPVVEQDLPLCLCERFGVQDPPGLLNLLRFLRELSTVSRGKSQAI